MVLQDVYFDADYHYFEAAVYTAETIAEGAYGFRVHLTFDPSYEWVEWGDFSFLYHDYDNYMNFMDMGVMMWKNWDVECYYDGHWELPIGPEFWNHFEAECAVYVWEDAMGKILINLYPYFNTFYLDWSNYPEDVFGMPMPTYTHMEDIYFDAEYRYFSGSVYMTQTGSTGYFGMTVGLTFDESFDYMTEGWMAVWSDEFYEELDIINDMGAMIYHYEDAECYEDEYWYGDWSESYVEDDLWMFYGMDCATFWIDSYEGSAMFHLYPYEELFFIEMDYEPFPGAGYYLVFDEFWFEPGSNNWWGDIYFDGADFGVYYIGYDFYFDDEYSYMTEGYMWMETYEDWYDIYLTEEGVSMWRDYNMGCWESDFFYDGSYDLWINGEWGYNNGGESDFDMYGYDCVSYDYCNNFDGGSECWKLTYHPWEDEFYFDLTNNPAAEDP